MEIFNLPPTAKVNKVIPKNAFDAYTNVKQKKLFTDLISRMSWVYKLSSDTINLEPGQVQEIQVFKVELKVKEDIQPLLDIIDKAIPYSIVFVVEFEDSIYLSTSTKHPHPVNEDNSVIDWTFRTTWFVPSENKYSFRLKKSLEAVYKDFCIQLSEQSEVQPKTLQDLVEFKRQIQAIEKDIAKLKANIASCKQFNRKVELNLKLKAKEKELDELQMS
ncbi:DUF4391 domain-containing protein [Runella zeae]|uniref:DUF4391 domain-containing protein n=1 Tax=Runella zeae TaxID=94255 RepID=UPI0004183C4A|nr:DUF4391 domain-containing protein [Runella zeae]